MARVLIVDDEKSIRVTLSAFLAEFGHETRAAGDAEEAQALLQQQAFDVVVSDIILPRVSGVELLRIIRQQAPDAQVIMMTGEPTVETAVATVRAGAHDYLTKPIGKQVILHAVQRAAQVKELLDERHRLTEANQRYQQQLEELVAQRTEALRDSEQRYRLLIENSEDAILLTAPDGRVFSANPAACQMFRRAEAEICRLGRAAVADANDPRLAAALAEQFQTGRFRGELSFRRGDGDVFPGEVSTAMFRVGDGELRTCVIIRDISERKQAEEQLRLLSVAVEQSPVSVVITNACGAIEYVNAKFTQVTGYTLDEARGKNPRFLKSGEVAAEEYRQLWETITTGREWRGEFHNRKKNGELYWELASISPILDAAGTITHFVAVKEDITGRKQAERDLRLFRVLIDRSSDAIEVVDPETGRFLDVNQKACADLGYTREEYLALSVPDVDPMVDFATFSRNIKALREGGVFTWQGLHRRKDGSTYPVEVNINHVELDRPYVVASVRDITERKHLEAQLLQSQKIEAIGRLAGGVAHDFNNILAAMLLRLDSMKEIPGLAAEAREDLNEIEKCAHRAAGLTRQLLLFGRRSAMTLRRLDVNAVVDNLLKMLRRLIGEDVTLRFHVSASLPGVDADAGMLEQVVMNLAVNARDAMPKGGCLTLSTEVVEVDAAQARRQPEAQPGRFVCLSVADTGCGMEERTLGQIFEPFFTTKEAGKGTGLGLATAYGIVTQHGGWITAESELGQGSTFRVFLPAAGETAAAEPAAEVKPVVGGKETILVVEDDPAVRVMLGTFLRRLGYQILEAGNGPEALEVWRDHRDGVDLLFTDMVMPEGMTGLDVARELRRDKPELKVIISSGYSAELAEPAELAALGIRYVPKPCLPLDLAAEIRACLDGKESGPGR